MAQGGSGTLTLQLGADGKLAFDVVVKDRSNKAVVYTRPESAHGRQVAAASERSRPDAAAQQDELRKTQQAIAKLLADRQAAAVPQAQKKEAQFIRYTPAKQASRARRHSAATAPAALWFPLVFPPENSTALLSHVASGFVRLSAVQLDEHNSGCAQRLLRLDDVAVDPLEPPRFKHKRVPAARFSPPPPVLHSPTRKSLRSPANAGGGLSALQSEQPPAAAPVSLALVQRPSLVGCLDSGKLTLQDQQDWKIPPCVSNWRNQKGYTIPLDKRVAADGRNLQDVRNRKCRQERPWPAKEKFSTNVLVRLSPSFRFPSTRSSLLCPRLCTSRSVRRARKFV